MAKPSPVMKHAKPKLTAEQIAVEDFMNSLPPAQVMEGDTFIDSTPVEVLETPVETSLDPIVDAVAAAGNLDELAEDVDGITQAPALEAYKRIFVQMSEMSGHPVAALENFPATKGGKARLARAIRQHADLIRGCVKLSFEEFTDQADKKVDQALANLKQVMAQLNKVQSNLAVPDKNVEVNHKAVWELFHINDELIDVRDFSAEINGIKELASLVSKGKDRIIQASTGEMSGSALEGKTFVQLMNNTDVKVEGGRATFEHQPVPKPPRDWTAGDWFWVFFFNFAGLAYRLIKGGSGAEKTKKEQSLKAVSKGIDELKKLGPVVEGIDKDVAAIIGAIGKAPGEKQSDLKRAASPVLELAAETAAHVAAVAHGMMKIFSQMQ